MNNTLEHWDLEELESLFAEAGNIALKYYDDPPAELKDDSSVVTLADRSIEELFARRCIDRKNGIFLIGEETIGKYDESYIAEALRSDRCWVLDPIDGTAPYSAHLDIWGISLGLMVQGRLQEGAVYFPVPDILLATCEGRVFFRKLRSASKWHIFTAIPCKLGIAGHIAIGQKQAHEWGFAGKNQLFAWSSCVGSIRSVLQGRTVAYCGDFKLWDIAGMLPILRDLNYPVLSTAADNCDISAAPVSNIFYLAPDTAASRWRIKNPIITAADTATAKALLEQFYYIKRD